jgi:ABC-2 type transport system permease protein
MQKNRVFAIVLRQFYLIRSSVSRIVPMFVWVGVDIILWGFLTRYLGSISPGFNFVPALLGAVLLWDFLVRVMQGITMAFMEDTWSRNFLNIFATPLSVTEYVSGLVLSSIATSAIGLVAMLVLATTLFGLSFFAYGIMLAPFLLGLFLFGVALGIFGCSIMLRFGPSAEWFIWPIPALVSPFAGVFYPIAVLPGWMQAVSGILPPSYIFEGMRAILAGGHPALSVWLGGIGLALIYILLACWCFTRVYNHAVKSGLIARYSAESVS